MAVLNNSALVGASGKKAGGYQISRSLRFSSGDSSYLSRTPGSAGNRKKFAYSTWVKFSNLSTQQAFFSARSDDNNRTTFFYQNNQFQFQNIISGSAVTVNTSAVFRDPSAWYHILLSVDTDQGTSSNRVRLYVNGVEQTLSGSYPGSGDNTQVNNTVAHAIGRIEYQSPSPTGYFDGYMADIYFLDGTATTPSTFAETDATTGQWVPKTPTGISYSTNGFRLTFSDNSGTTSTTLGKDAAGSNNWSPNNFSVASGSGNDSLVDSPSSYGTDTGAGGEVRGNYALANALDNGGQTLANGNLDITGISANWRSTRGTIGMSSGKWYWEVTIGFTNGAGNQSLLGIATGAASISGNYASAGAFGWEYYSSNGNKFNNGSNPSYGASYTNGDVIGVAFDADAGSLTFYKNGSSQGTAYTGLTSGPYFPSFSLYGASLVSFNGGQRAFAYTAPSGFKALCDTNLTAPVIAKPNTVFDIIRYTGNGSTQTIPNVNTVPATLGFSPDLVWTKQRNGNNEHALVDVVRGVQQTINSDRIIAEYTTGSVTAFNSDGFNVGSSVNTNQNGSTYVAWCWDVGGQPTTDNVAGAGNVPTAGSVKINGANMTTALAGTIPATRLSANTAAGCSIVGYTGNGSSGATVSHGGLVNLDKGMIIIKKRTSSPGNTNWRVYHSALGNTQAIYLSDTGAATSGSGFWNNTSPTSTVFTLGSDDGLNASGQTHIAYCFAPVTNYSSFGSYVGNGTNDNSAPFIWTGFRPRWIMIKAATNAGDMSYASWLILDTSRSSYNICTESLYANASYQEGLRGNGTSSGTYLDILSNGFKIKYNGSEVNGVNGQTYVYAAFAESPFQYARAR